MPSGRPLFRFDPGWVWIAAGLLIVFVATVVPAQRALERDRAELRRLQAAEDRAYRLLEAHDRFLADLREGNPALLQRLAAASLNRMPAESEAVLLAGSIDQSPVEWIESSVPPVPSVGTPRFSLLERLVSGPGGLWMTGAGLLCLFVGLMLSPTGILIPGLRRRAIESGAVPEEPWDLAADLDGEAAGTAPEGSDTASAADSGDSDLRWAPVAEWKSERLEVAAVGEGEPAKAQAAAWDDRDELATDEPESNEAAIAEPDAAVESDPWSEVGFAGDLGVIEALAALEAEAGLAGGVVARSATEDELEDEVEEESELEDATEAELEDEVEEESEVEDATAAELEDEVEEESELEDATEEELADEVEEESEVEDAAEDELEDAAEAELEDEVEEESELEDATEEELEDEVEEESELEDATEEELEDEVEDEVEEESELEDAAEAELEDEVEEESELEDAAEAELEDEVEEEPELEDATEEELEDEVEEESELEDAAEAELEDEVEEESELEDATEAELEHEVEEGSELEDAATPKIEVISSGPVHAADRSADGIRSSHSEPNCDRALDSPRPELREFRLDASERDEFGREAWEGQEFDLHDR